MNIEQIGEDSLKLIKDATWFPYDPKSGNLKFKATKGNMHDSTTYVITFDSSVAPYVAALEDGSKPHDIPFAFGRERWKDGRYPFGVGGKFNGKFHPGSNKHKGFISEKCVNAIIRNICIKYNGELR